MNVQTKIDPIKNAYASQRFVYFDIETIPSQDPELLSEFRKTIKAPASFKKPESIQKWIDENADSAAAEKVGKTSFDGAYGHVCSIGWAKNDGDIYVAHAKSIADERQVISDFFEDLDPYHSETLVGHNIAGFDLGFLRKRAVALGVRLPSSQTFPRDPKPWDKAIVDTMSAWGGGRDTISMDNLCAALGIEGKDGFDGSMVADAWLAGEHQKISEYCQDDVRRTREIHKRFLQVGF